MLTNNPSLKSVTEDLLSAGILLGVCSLIVLFPETASRPTVADERPAAIQPSVVQPAASQNATDESQSASMQSTLLKAQ